RRHTRSDRDWSSDVCSSDLNSRREELSAMRIRAGLYSFLVLFTLAVGAARAQKNNALVQKGQYVFSLTGGCACHSPPKGTPFAEIGRASCRERGKIRGGGAV